MAIPTIYEGIEYRSRLEARWAAFFDIIGWEHTYEPFDGKGYIPDFVLHGKFPCLVEVKPAVTSDQYRAPTEKIDRGLDGIWEGRVVVVGASPLPRLERDGWLASIGLIRARYSDGYGWEAAILRETSSGVWGFCEEWGSYAHSPSGFYDGNQANPGESLEPIKAAWAKATNLVKWRGRDAA